LLPNKAAHYSPLVKELHAWCSGSANVTAGRTGEGRPRPRHHGPARL